MIVEAHKDLAAQYTSNERSDFRRARPRIKRLLAKFTRRSPVASGMGVSYFDGIVFDTFPLSTDELRRNHFPFLPVAFDWLRPDGRLTYFSDEPITLSEMHQKEIANSFGRPLVHVRHVELHPWKTCEYWHHNEIRLIVITKVGLLRAKECLRGSPDQF